MKKTFLDDNEQILYQPQKDIKMFLWFASSLTLCFIFIIFTALISIFSLFSTLNLVNFSFFTFTFAAFILFSYIYIILLSDFFFTHMFVTNKRVVIVKTFSRKNKEIQFRDIESCSAYAYTSFCIKQRDVKSYCINFVKNPHILIEKIIEQCPSCNDLSTIYKSKINEHVLLIFLNIPFLFLYLLLVFNTSHIKSFYYKFMGDRYEPKCHSVTECINIKKSSNYTKSVIKANDYYIKALEYDTNDVSLYVVIAHNYVNLKKYDDAISILKTALLLNSENKGDLYYELACVYEENENYALAIKSFKTSLNYEKKGSPAEFFVKIHLASIYKKLGQKM